MKSTTLTNLVAVVVITGVCISSANRMHAQAPPGPLPAAAPQPPSSSAAKSQDQQPAAPSRTTIFGAWKLNRDESDDARKKMQDAGKARGSNSGGYGGGRRMGGGWPGGGGYGGHRRGGQESGENNDESARMQELFHPANSLTLAQKDPKDPEIDLTDDQNRKRALFTDKRKLQKSKDEKYQEIAARWHGNRLVTDEKNARGGKMSRTFELSSDGTQLYETLHLAVGRSNTPVTIRYIYDATPQNKQ
jgi:hypothetical protein